MVVRSALIGWHPSSREYWDLSWGSGRPRLKWKSSHVKWLPRFVGRFAQVCDSCVLRGELKKIWLDHIGYITKHVPLTYLDVDRLQQHNNHQIQVCLGRTICSLQSCDRCSNPRWAGWPRGYTGRYRENHGSKSWSWYRRICSWLSMSGRVATITS